MANKISLLVVQVVLCAVVWGSLPQMAQAAAEGCPELVPVPIDEDFLFKQQPKEGFHSAYGSGENGMPKYTAKPMDSKSIAGPNSICVKSKLRVSGQEMVSVPPMPCSYAQSPSHVFCDMKVGAGAAAAVAATGIKIPKASIATIVDTDNSTYLAWGSCLDGAVFEWVIYSKEPKLAKVDPKTLEALHIDQKTLDESTKLNFKPGTTQITKGPCPASKTAALAGKLKQGLGGLGGGGLGGGLFGGK